MQVLLVEPESKDEAGEQPHGQGVADQLMLTRLFGDLGRAVGIAQCRFVIVVIRLRHAECEETVHLQGGVGLTVGERFVEHFDTTLVLVVVDDDSGEVHRGDRPQRTVRHAGQRGGQ